MRSLQVDMALEETMPEIISTRKHFGEKTQVSKLMEELSELRPHLHRYLAMGAAGYNVDLEHSLTADEIADVLVVIHGLLACNDKLDNAVADRIYYKTHRTIERINSGYYSPDGRARVDREVDGSGCRLHNTRSEIELGEFIRA